MPHAGMTDWMSKPESERKEAEDKMKQEWDVWMLAHKDMILETAGTGQTTKVTTGASEAAHNDIMLYSLIQGENRESVTKTFEDHPHLGIPTSWIEVMECNVLPPLQ